MRWTGSCAVLLWAMGCGGPTPPAGPADVDVTEDDGPPTRVSGKDPTAPAVDAEIGALDGDAVRSISDGLRGEVERCFASANADLDLPLVAGDVEISFRVKGDGSVRWAYMSRSDVGDAEVEECILQLIRGETWPEPEGGEEGLARATYGRGPEGRAPTPWSAGDLGGAGATLSTKLAGCRSQAGAASLAVTFYVDADGRPLSAGVASGDEKGLEAVACATTAVLGATYPSPGSYPAKVTVRVP